MPAPDEDLLELMKARNSAKTEMEVVGMQNTVGLTPEDRLTLDIAWQRAMSRYEQAEMRYQAAVRRAAMGKL